MLSPSSLLSKIIGVLARNGGEKWNQHHCRVGSMSLLNMALVCIHVGLGTYHLVFHLPPWVWVILLTSHLLFSSSSWPLIFWCQILPNPLSCRHYVQEKLTSANINLPLILCWSWFVNIISLCLMWMMWETLWPTFDQGHFLSTSAHYPGGWSRDSLLVPWNLHASMAGSSHSTRGFHHWPPIEWFYGCSMPAHWFTCRRLYL